MSKTLIKAVDLAKTYGSGEAETKALCGVSFEIQEGEFVSIMGPSGSGKSTLMQILGFLDRASGGEYFFMGKNAEKFSDDELALVRNQEIGFIFQTFNLLPKTSVFENVELPLLYNRSGLAQKESATKVNKALESVMMSHRATYFSNMLSGGEKQRVAIARALVNSPSLIFADEPTGNLDSQSGLKVMEILQKLNEQGKTIILVTHETFTAEHAKRILRIKDGLLAGDEPVVHRRFASQEKTLK